MKMAVLLSGSGRTLDNFHDRIAVGTMHGSIEVVISNVADVLGLKKAEKYGYPAFHGADNVETNRIISDYDVDLVILAGYLKLYQPPPELTRAVLLVEIGSVFLFRTVRAIRFWSIVSGVGRLRTLI